MSASYLQPIRASDKFGGLEKGGTALALPPSFASGTSKVGQMSKQKMERMTGLLYSGLGVELCDFSFSVCPRRRPDTREIGWPS